MGLTWEEHGSYMGGTTMKEKDKGINILSFRLACEGRSNFFIIFFRLFYNL